MLSKKRETKPRLQITPRESEEDDFRALRSDDGGSLMFTEWWGGGGGQRVIGAGRKQKFERSILRNAGKIIQPSVDEGRKTQSSVAFPLGRGKARAE